MAKLARLWLAAALLFQGVVVQAHAHALVDPGVRAATTTAVASSVAARKQTPTAPACPLCEEQALFGAYLLAGSITIVAPVAAARDYTIATLPRFALTITSHAWRSRAPPTFTA